MVNSYTPDLAAEQKTRIADRSQVRADPTGTDSRQPLTRTRRRRNTGVLWHCRLAARRDAHRIVPGSPAFRRLDGPEPSRESWVVRAGVASSASSSSGIRSHSKVRRVAHPILGCKRIVRHHTDSTIGGCGCGCASPDRAESHHTVGGTPRLPVARWSSIKVSVSLH